MILTGIAPMDGVDGRTDTDTAPPFGLPRNVNSPRSTRDNYCGVLGSRVSIPPAARVLPPIWRISDNTG